MVEIASTIPCSALDHPLFFFCFFLFFPPVALFAFTPPGRDPFHLHPTSTRTNLLTLNALQSFDIALPQIFRILPNLQ